MNLIIIKNILSKLIEKFIYNENQDLIITNRINHIKNIVKYYIFMKSNVLM